MPSMHQLPCPMHFGSETSESRAIASKCIYNAGHLQRWNNVKCIRRTSCHSQCTLVQRQARAGNRLTCIYRAGDVSHALLNTYSRVHCTSVPRQARAEQSLVSAFTAPATMSNPLRSNTSESTAIAWKCMHYAGDIP